MSEPDRTHKDYLVGWICPLEVEQIAATLMLDEKHKRLTQPASDHNVYTLGSIYGHNVVIAGLPTTGNNAAATVATQMRSTFPQMRFGLLVGIGGGIPTTTDEGPIHLGDVIVSKPVKEHSGAVQYDHGKAVAGRFERTGSLAPPPSVLLNAAQKLAVDRAVSSVDPLAQNLGRIDTAARRLRRLKHPGSGRDNLYRAGYVHRDSRLSCRSCQCEESEIITRGVRNDDESEEEEESDESNELVVHRGTVASGELVMKDGILRDELAQAYDLLCFETEAAGAMADFPCLVVRGISDYCDSHKNNDWHGYAAAAAAAYARELFAHMPVEDVEHCKVATADIDHIKRRVDFIASDNQQKQILDWLSVPDSSVNYNEALKLRHGRSGSWLLHSEAFQSWKNGQGSFLWLAGLAGCGKTIISSTIIENLKQMESNKDHVVAYFYFDFKNVSKQTHNSMLKSLVYQISSKNNWLWARLRNLYESCSWGLEQPADSKIEALFQNALEHIERIDIILDALDECSSRALLLSWLKSLIGSRTASLNIIVTSRKEEDILDTLEPLVNDKELVDLEGDSVNQDISLYIKGRLYNGSEFERWGYHGDTLSLIETHLTDRAQSMFRWAACQLDTLGTCLDLEQLEETLRTIPMTLDETYARMIQNIDRGHRRKAIALLQVMLVSDRPLRLEEAIDVVATNTDRHFFDPRYRMPRPRDIARLCPSLVTITNASSEMLSEVGFAHFSVKEYLLSGRLAPDLERDLSKKNVACSVVKISLSYLMRLSCLASTERIQVDMPWARHAAEYWFQLGHEAINDKVSTFLMSRLFNSDLYHEWLSIFDPEHAWEEGGINAEYQSPPLYYAAFGGLEHCAEQLLREGADINAQGGEYGNALQAALSRGHEAIARLLIERDADVNAQGGFYGNALQAASYVGHEDIARLLIEKDADVNAQGGFYSNALQAASYGGHEEIVRLLIEKDADINAQGSKYGNALQAASSRGYEDIVRLLVDNGTDVNAQGGEYGNALQAASSRGYEEIARLLINNGADVNAQGGKYSNALQAALYRGHEEIARLLIEKGADVKAQGFYDHAL